MHIYKLLPTALFALPFVHAIELDISSADSIKTAAKTVAQDLVNGYYTNHHEIPGVLPSPYYWWSGGALWDSLVSYWYLTGDSQFNDVVSQALLFQTGEHNDYLPANQSTSEGNDDQATWALAALSAAERKFPSPSADKPQWIDLAKNVFDEQVLRWDSATCGGGLRWQILSLNTGYDYKQSQTWFFLLAARLAQYTGNATYSDWANKIYDWSSTTGLISDKFQVYDGANTKTNCLSPSKILWSYNQAGFLYGSAVMFNMTPSETWRKRVSGHLSSFSSTFFSNSSSDTTILREVACESTNTCATDQAFYKGIASRWLGQTILSAPYTADQIKPLLKVSAQAAASTCTNGDDGRACGLSWVEDKLKKTTGLGEQLSALEVIQQNLNGLDHSLATSSSAGSPTSGGNSTSGTSGTSGGAATTSQPPGNAASVLQVTWWVMALGAVFALL